MTGVSVELPAEVESVRNARRAVEMLPLDDHSEAAFNFRLLVSEVITNSLCHAAGSAEDTILLKLQITSTRARVEVIDSGPGFVPPVFDDPPEGSHGRGLYLVDALADCWGAESTAIGWLVWFELTL